MSGSPTCTTHVGLSSSSRQLSSRPSTSGITGRDRRSTRARITGRLALPPRLRRRRAGSSSPTAMVRRLRAKPHGDAIGGHDRRLRDSARRPDLPPRVPRAKHDRQPHHPGRTGGLLPQCRVSSGARWMLRRRGLRTPLRRLPPGTTTHVFAATPTHLGFEEYDVAAQIAHSHHYWVEDGRVETFSAPVSASGHPSWT